MANRAKRDRIVAPQTDVKQLKVCRKTDYDARKQFQESGATSGDAHSPHQYHNFCNEDEDGAKSVDKRQKMAKYAGASGFSMRRVITDDLQLTPHKNSKYR